jgi:hypothetical protein
MSQAAGPETRQTVKYLPPIHGGVINPFRRGKQSGRALELAITGEGHPVRSQLLGAQYAATLEFRLGFSLGFGMTFYVIRHRQNIPELLGLREALCGRIRRLQAMLGWRYSGREIR